MAIQFYGGRTSVFVALALGCQLVTAPAFSQSAPVELELSYDSLGRVTSVRDGNGIASGDATRASTFFSGGAGYGAWRDAAGGTVRITYDGEDRPIAQADELGRVTRTVYDVHGRVADRIYPEGNKVAFGYDANHNVVRVRTHAKPGSPEAGTYLEVTAGWDATWNKPLWIRDARGQQTDYTYYAAGQPGAGLVATQTMPAVAGGRPAYQWTYNSFGQVLSTTDPSGLVVQHTYSNINRFLASRTVDPGGVGAVTTFTSNAAGDVIEVDGPRTDVADVSNITYDGLRRKVLEVAPATASGRSAVRTNYDLSGRVSSVEKGSYSGTTFTPLRTVSYDYDPSGNKVRETSPAGVTQYSYDALNRLTCSAVRTNPAAYNALPQSACTPSVIGGFGPDQISRNSYNLAGELIQTERGVGFPEQAVFAAYSHTANGKRASVTDGNNNRTSLTYDGFDRLARQIFPSPVRGAATSNASDFEEYGYDANGNRSSFRRRDGQLITYQYDAMNRMTVKDLPGGGTQDVYYAYDLAGRMTSARFSSTGGSGVVMTYDTAGRRITEATFGRTLYSQYDPAGNRTRLEWPNAAFVTYHYDAAGRLSEIRESGSTSGQARLAVYSYDAVGQRTQLARGNGTRTDYGYDGAGRLSSLSQVVAPEAAGSYQTLTYTPASQLASLTQATAAYVWTGQPTTSWEYTHDGLNRDAAIAAHAEGYDARGNLTFDGVRNFTYDVENRLVENRLGGAAQMTIAYDPIGRIREVVASGATTQFLYDGERLVAEFDGTGTSPLRRYVHGTGVDEPVLWYEGSGTGDRRWLHSDRQGSIIGWTNGAGAVSVYTYGPYGEPQDWQGSRFRYTGQIALPEAQLYHYKARVYDPMRGQFLQTDPIGFEDDPNLYAYVAGDPVNRTDPTGTYGRGSGWDKRDSEWEAFDRAQKRAADAMEKRASKLEAKADKLDGKGKEGGDTLRGVATSLRAGAEALRSDGSDGRVANAVDSATYQRMGGSKDGAAFVAGHGPVMVVNQDNTAAFQSGGAMIQWTVGHESLHTAGLSDQRVNDVLAYKHGEPEHREAFRNLPRELRPINPDHIMEMVFPSLGAR